MIFIQRNCIENVVCKIVAIFFSAPIWLLTRVLHDHSWYLIQYNFLNSEFGGENCYVKSNKNASFDKMMKGYDLILAVI